MGRRQKYKTYDELLTVKRQRATKYYQLNKEECKRKARDRYNKLKEIYE
jgi:hypothetical protein